MTLLNQILGPRTLLVMFILFFSSNALLAQESYTIVGIVHDSESETSVPYATIVTKSISENKVLSGVISNDDGTFTITSKSAEVYIEISFMGYRPKAIRDLKFVGKNCNVGTVSLVSDIENIGEVVVRAEKSSVEFRLDKKVFNVGQDIVSSGASATDVLNNVPSVNVDIEGNVSLRGNSGVQILINGKPSVLSEEGSNALASITADMIESVEVITNPSAKYEAGGTAGIINIVLKKEEKKGLNGSLTLNTGIPENHSVGVSLNYRTEKFNFFTQMGAGYRSLPRQSESITNNLATGDKIESQGTQYRNEWFHNITLGTDYYINKLNVITLSGNFAYEIEDQPSATNFSLTDSVGSFISEWQRTEMTSATNPKYQYDLQYKREFKNNKKHVFLMSTLGKFFGKELSSEFSNRALSGTEVNPNQQTNTNFYQADYTLKMDYTRPLNKKVTYEGGGMYQMNDVGNDYAVYDWVASQWIADSGYSNNFRYDQKVLGAYSTTSYEGKKWSLKLGLRLENTDLTTRLLNTNQVNDQNYTNLFPSAHSSFKVSKYFSVQAGYSKRIYRPRLWDLNPFFNIRNNYSIRTGNPNLQPEYANSYEFTAIWVLKKFYINGSIYYLHKTDLIERVSTAIDNVSYTTPMNIGTMGKTGLEFNMKYDPSKWFSARTDFNFGFFDRKGNFNGQDFNFSNSQWSSKLNMKFKLPKKFDLETTANYQSNYQTVQGTQSGFIYFNAGIRKKIKKGKFVINANIRDLFASRIRENTIYQGDYYIYNYSRRGRFLTLGVSYSFGKGEAMTYSGRHHH